MGKDKLKRFNELMTMERVFQPTFEEIFQKDFHLKGKWNTIIFKNQNPLVLELGCGKGEYTTGLAREYPGKNFIGVDIKGARIWKGAKESNLFNINNSAFLRTRIEFISSFFQKNEVDEIWLTFPDPQAKKRRHKKRLTSPFFLSLYQKILRDQGTIHLKTDSEILYDYTMSMLLHNKINIACSTEDLYKSEIRNMVPDIKTFYEKQYLEKRKTIHYLKFHLPADIAIREPDNEQ